MYHIINELSNISETINFLINRVKAVKLYIYFLFTKFFDLKEDDPIVS